MCRLTGLKGNAPALPGHLKFAVIVKKVFEIIWPGLLLVQPVFSPAGDWR
jgi:hypothetical protein